MKNRMKRLTALLLMVSLCTGTVYAESETALADIGAEVTEAQTKVTVHKECGDKADTEAAQTESACETAAARK